jgi:hypothetical protein
MNSKIIRKIEEQVLRELLLTANDAGWPCIGFDDGDGFERETFYEELVSHCLNLDEVTLFFSSPKEDRCAWVYLVFGNDGHDLICNNEIVDGFEQLVMDKMTDYCENIADKLFS